MEVNIFLKDLQTKTYGKNLKPFESVESTNKKLIEDLNNGVYLEEGSVYLALKQTDGRGSYGNSWQSDNDLGLWFSVLLYSPYKKKVLSFLPCIALSKLAREKYKLKAHIKWPNDVLAGHKKISGTLAQILTLKNGREACVIGTGINLFHKEEDFTEDIRNKATSLFLETGVKVKLEEFYREFMYYFEYIYNGEKSLIELFRTYCDMIGKKIKAKKDGMETEALVKDITEEGYLRVEVNGVMETWISRTSLDIETFY